MFEDFDEVGFEDHGFFGVAVFDRLGKGVEEGQFILLDIVSSDFGPGEIWAEGHEFGVEGLESLGEFFKFFSVLDLVFFFFSFFFLKRRRGRLSFFFWLF